jgi:dihydrofolate synthase/folylpolyglutamate synthase
MEKAPATYPATLDFLYNRLPMFSRVGAVAFKKDLTNIVALSDALGNPQQRFKSIHIAGTNGKGSVSHMIAAVLQQSGYKTGLYTSPHLKDFRERIRIDGKMISKDFVVGFVRENFALVQQISPSFFEITVAMAFAWFARNACPVAVVEVGLGGRLDSTNILQPELSVITNISYDHQQILGDTLTQIAGEKAGIIKPGIPVVIGETDPETKVVFEQVAARLESPIVFADQWWKITSRQTLADQLGVELHRQSGEESLPVVYRTDLTGAYQVKNLMTVLTAVTLLQQRHWHIGYDATRQALSAVKRLTGLRGRWEVIGNRPLVIADVAHNEAGIREVTRQAGMLPYEKLHIVTGFVRDKSIDAILELFPAEAIYYFCQAAIPRALPSTELAAMAGGYGLKGKAYSQVKDAFAAARACAGPDDVILVCGSVFVVAEVLP